jgi:hypothetical protein
LDNNVTSPSCAGAPTGSTGTETTEFEAVTVTGPEFVLLANYKDSVIRKRNSETTA